jgi:hypothetical protein
MIVRSLVGKTRSTVRMMIDSISSLDGTLEFNSLCA